MKKEEGMERQRRRKIIKREGIVGKDDRGDKVIWKGRTRTFEERIERKK